VAAVLPNKQTYICVQT